MPATLGGKTCTMTNHIRCSPSLPRPVLNKSGHFLPTKARNGKLTQLKGPQGVRENGWFVSHVLLASMTASSSDQSSFLKPISLAYSRKHCLHMLMLYFRIIPWRLEHARLQKKRGTISEYYLTMTPNVVTIGVTRAISKKSDSSVQLCAWRGLD